MWIQKARCQGSGYACQVKNSIMTNMGFFGQFLRAPGKTGAVCPSSRFLARALAEMSLGKKLAHGLIVDLGAGSGVVSRELLRYGVEPEKILAVDISNHFNETFTRHCPGIELQIGDARNLAKIIAARVPSVPVHAIISSLPLRSLPLHVVEEIMLEIRNVLQKNAGTLIQFTYALWMQESLEPFGFRRLESRYVPLNFPPALVEKYRPGL